MDLSEISYVLTAPPWSAISLLHTNYFKHIQVSDTGPLGLLFINPSYIDKYKMFCCCRYFL